MDEKPTVQLLTAVSEEKDGHIIPEALNATVEENSYLTPVDDSKSPKLEYAPVEGETSGIVELYTAAGTQDGSQKTSEEVNNSTHIDTGNH